MKIYKKNLQYITVITQWVHKEYKTCQTWWFFSIVSGVLEKTQTGEGPEKHPMSAPATRGLRDPPWPSS